MARAKNKRVSAGFNPYIYNPALAFRRDIRLSKEDRKRARRQQQREKPA